MEPLICSDEVQAELGRCLDRLVTLFPAGGFRAPEIVIDTGYPPLPETPLEPDWGRMTLYARRDLIGSPEDILTILLHKAIHTYHAFLWQRDCTHWSYHTRQFLDQAEQVGFRVSWMNRRYGWAKTIPGPGLRDLFEDLAAALPSSHGVSRRDWHCGQQRFPSRADLEGSFSCPPAVEARSLHVHHRDGLPMVRLSGRWLSRLGFRAGCRLKVEGCDGRLTIEARPEVTR